MILYLIIVVTCIITLPQNGLVYEVQLLVLSSVFLCLALGFCLIGSIQSQKLSGLVQSQVVRETARKVKCASIVCVIFFTCRCIAWAWEPLTGCVYFGAKDLDIIIYPWFYFTVPESVNVVSILYMLKPSNTVSRRARGDSWADARSDAFFPEFGSGGGNSNRGTYSPPDGRLFIDARGQGRDEMLLETI